jgi:hypothetical protein
MSPASREEARAAEAATGTSQALRFALELEFVMALANPRYLHRTSPEGPNFTKAPHFIFPTCKPPGVCSPFHPSRCGVGPYPTCAATHRLNGGAAGRARFVAGDVEWATDPPLFLSFLSYVVTATL